MNSIGDVLALTPGPSWHECVAIVQEIAAHLEPGQPLPAPEDLLLEPDGAITFGFAGESTRPQVADLASLLATFLEKTDAPQGLRDLATENARDEPAHSTIASFTRALTFYERPNRLSDLQALAGRLDGRSQNAQAERALAEIRERVARNAEEKTEPKKEARKPEPEKPAAAAKTDRQRAIARARALAIAAAVVLAAAAVSAMTILRGWDSGKKPGAEAASQADVAAVPPQDASQSDADDSTPTERPVATERASPIHPIATSAPAGWRRDSKSRPGPVAGPSGGSARSAEAKAMPNPTAERRIAPVRSLPPANVKTDPRVDSAPAATRSGNTTPASRLMLAGDTVSDPSPLYSSANAEVTPPVWSRRQLPREPAPDSDTGYFDIVIDTNGDVESIRLISATQRYEERMLMAAAKAWKFRPARLNGQPVKYRMRVPITLTWTIDR
jgi:sRNA-binding protein